METGRLRKIFSSFSTLGRWRDCCRFGSGHIHDTFRIRTAGSSAPDYIMQRINTGVFRDVPMLQANIETVTGHIRKKLQAIPGSDPLRQCLTPVPAADGKTWHRERDGSYWRLFIYITDHRTYDRVESEALASEGGTAVGKFVAMLADLPGAAVGETIPDFHNTPLRIERFIESVRRDVAGRAAAVRDETEKILGRAGGMHAIANLGHEGAIPLRVTHNDTKFNNVLLDLNNKALCLIDLDTVMPGYVHYDFGDAIRTAANTGEEDAADTATVGLSLPLYRAWTRGFMGETRNILTETEIRWLPFAPRLLTYEQALRFLADYIEGDVYYRVHDTGHNLRRARAQIRLLESMEDSASEMEAVVNIG